jgi:hypothetical protein
MKFLRISTAVFAFSLALAQTPPAKTPKDRKPQIREVRATGCVRIARDGCILLKTLDGNTTYTFRVAPKPDEGAVVTIQGTAHDGPSNCKQGIAIDVTDWDPTGDTCVE